MHRSQKERRADDALMVTRQPMAKTGQNLKFLGARISVGKYVHRNALTWDISSALN